MTEESLENELRKRLSLSWKHRREGRRDLTIPIVNEVERSCREKGLNELLLKALLYQSRLAGDDGDRERELKICEERVSISNDLGKPDFVAQAYKRLGEVQNHMDLNEESLQNLSKAYGMYQKLDGTKNLDWGGVHYVLAQIKEKFDEIEEAKFHWRKAIHFYTKANVKEGIEECEDRLAKLRKLE